MIEWNMTRLVPARVASRARSISLFVSSVSTLVGSRRKCRRLQGVWFCR